MFMINLINRIATRKIVSLIFSIIFFFQECMQNISLRQGQIHKA